MAIKSGTTDEVLAEQRWQMIAEAAYYRAESRGFAPGDAMADWLQAEAEIDAMLATTPDAEEVNAAERETVLQRLEMLLHDWERRAEELTAAARQAGDRLQSEIHEQVAALPEQRLLARQKLAAVRMLGAAKWHEVRDHALQFFEELHHSAEQIATRVKASIGKKQGRPGG